MKISFDCLAKVNKPIQLIMSVEDITHKLQIIDSFC